MECKVSKKEIKPFMSFGKMPLANGFLEKKSFNKEFFYEMEVGFSEKFSLFQLNDHPKPEKMFNETYPFYTGSSEVMKKHFKNYANWINKFFGSAPSKLIEIGSNDGVMLEHLVNNGIKCLGVEPSLNVAEVSHQYGVETINEFISVDTAHKISNSHGYANVVYAANVFCHIPDITI